MVKGKNQVKMIHSRAWCVGSTYQRTWWIVERFGLLPLSLWIYLTIRMDDSSILYATDSCPTAMCAGPENNSVQIMLEEQNKRWITIHEMESVRQMPRPCCYLFCMYSCCTCLWMYITYDQQSTELSSYWYPRGRSSECGSLFHGAILMFIVY
jgi:hypothetical protein